MNARAAQFNNVFTFFLSGSEYYPGAPELRARIAALPTTHARALVIKDLSQDVILSMCRWVLEDLIKQLLANGEYSSTRVGLFLENIRFDLRKEFSFAYHARNGWTNMINRKVSLAGCVRNLNSQIEFLEQHLRISDASLTSWQELSDWFIGRYYAAAYKDGNLKHYRKNRFGNYPYLDMDDRFFWLFSTIKKLDLIMPYYQISTIIDQRIKAHALPAVVHPQPSAPPLEPEPVAPPLTDSEVSESDTSESKARGEFECPITMRTMKAAAICLLDGCSYEAAVLQASIEMSGMTPTRIPVSNDDIFKVMSFNVNLQQAINSYRANKSEEASYRCTVTGEIMRDAVFCVLDKKSYDAVGIRGFLSANKKTPDGTLLPDGVNIDDVLIANRALRKAIETYQNELTATIDLGYFRQPPQSF